MPICAGLGWDARYHPIPVIGVGGICMSIANENDTPRIGSLIRFLRCPMS
jgi:hypothetical protein